MDIHSLNALQASTLKAFNSLVKNLNKADIETNEGFAIIDAKRLESEIGNLHNNLAFLLGIRDPETGLSLWEKNPEKSISSITWDEQ